MLFRDGLARAIWVIVCEKYGINTSATERARTTTSTEAPRPYIRCPNDLDVELPPRRATARVSFPQPKTNVDWYRYVDASPAWGKQLQADLPPGLTMLTFTAWSSATNYTNACRMMIRIRGK
ncbi:hypothetical protein TSAR_007144 [Trichomalopsis sarcophagae]|uniref:HYR domain-containing protein n=1 Tax=Trichomalopsis sarcophagae TaxID=543379 RepID=A0A232FGI6_9HYME|nr:hypothetical protein TSAR_007144 [Trichomalopsis sarcophagae]